MVVGDDATTDIAGGRAAGLRTVQVRTGKYADQRAEGLTGQATHELDSVVGLPGLIRELGGRMTVYWVVWDAGAHWVVDRLEREGALPAVTRMRERGVFTAARPARPQLPDPALARHPVHRQLAGEHRSPGTPCPARGRAPRAMSAGSRPVPRHAAGVGGDVRNDLTSALVHAPWVFDGTTRGPHIDGAVEAYSGRLTGTRCSP